MDAVPVLAAGSYLHWGVIQISVANLVVIGAMLVLFIAALLVPFPVPRRTFPPTAGPAAHSADEAAADRGQRR